MRGHIAVSAIGGDRDGQADPPEGGRDPTRDIVAGSRPRDARAEPPADDRGDGLRQVIRARVKILFVAADVCSQHQLALDEEHRAIQRNLRAAQFRDVFEIVSELAARPADLQRAMLQHRPDIVHVTCHGSANAELLLRQDDGTAAPLAATALVSYFRILRNNIALVVLNACSTSKQAAAIGTCIGLAIGMRRTITDAVAIRFSAAFYEGLGYGCSVRQAFDLGVAAVGPEQADVPALFERADIDADAICFAGEPARARRGPRRAAVRAWRGRIAAAAVACALTGLSSPASAPSSHKPGELALEVTVRVSGSRSAVLDIVDQVVSRDAIQVAVRPAVDAHVYVAYCDHDRRLTIFPGEGAITAPAGVITYVPARDAHIVIDDQVGSEVLYVIASRALLDSADPEIAAEISRARPDAEAECGSSLEGVLDPDQQRLHGPGEPEPPRIRGDPPIEPSVPSRPLNVDAWDAAGAPHPAQTRASLAARAERGASVQWGAPGNGPREGERQDIVVRRYHFTHVARRAP